MCGIVGLIDLSGRLSTSHMVARMADTMIKRGPDGYGEFVEGGLAMAMRRLSIIDLEHGWQPLTSRDGNVVAFQNGEIYNFQLLKNELAKAGYVFKTSSDTEVLAHGYDAWGIDGLLKKLDGMYAIAIYDRQTRTLHLARDRFGEKPLFYTARDGFFAYSSNTLALKIFDNGSMGISPMGLNYYLAMHFIPGDITIFENIFRVLPGERLEVNIDTLKLTKVKYYEIPIGRVKISTDELASMLEDSVKSRLVADVPVGVFLSGGLDSSIVAAIASRFKNKIDTFSMGFHSKEHDESQYAQELASQIGSTHHQFYFDEDAFLDLMPRVADALDEPVGDQAMLPLYWLAQEASKHVKVVLSGEGADEIFGGYQYYESFASIRPAKPFMERVKSMLSGSSKFSDGLGLDTLMENSNPTTPSGFPLLMDFLERKTWLDTYDTNGHYEKDLIKFLSKSRDSLQRASLADFTTWLPDDLLVKLDRMGMAHSIEGRAPYLNPAIVSAGMNLPPEQKINLQGRKEFLKRTAHKWVPESLINRKKQGFVLPMRKWIVQWFESHGGPDNYVRNRPIPHLDADLVIDAIKSDIERGLHRERLWFAVILLIEWHESYLKRSLNS